MSWDFVKTEIKGARLVNMVEEISRKPNVQAVALVFLAAFSEMYTEKEDQTQFEKFWVFIERDCKVNALESNVTEKISIETKLITVHQDDKKDAFRASQ